MPQVVIRNGFLYSSKSLHQLETNIYIFGSKKFCILNYFTDITGVLDFYYIFFSRPAEKPEDSWDAFNIVSTEENNLKREERIAFFHKVRSMNST